jgi:hypothetical protein
MSQIDIILEGYGYHRVWESLPYIHALDKTSNYTEK